MRHFLLFILPVLTIITAGMVVFGLIQTRVHDQRANEDLKRRVKAITESTSVLAAHIFSKNDTMTAEKLVATFAKRDRLQVYTLYDAQGRVFATTPHSDSMRINRDYLAGVLDSRQPQDALVVSGGVKFYCYAIPVTGEAGQLIGITELVYERKKPQEEQTAFWRRLSLFLLALSVLLILLTIVLQRHIFFHPLRKITAWFHSYLQGEAGSMKPGLADSHLRKFASEVEQLALSLKVARRSLSQKATSRHRADDQWTEEKLRNLVHARLGESSLCVVSNREPLMHTYDKNSMSVKTITPAGGVVTAIHPILEACGGTWVAHGSGDQDRHFVNSGSKLGIPADDVRYILKRVWLTKEEEEGYYYGFSNEGLWPLCHNTHTRPVFRESDWKMYREANRKFAESVISELPAQNAFVFIQDYHFTLLAKYIREKRPDVTIALFWHIPWPNPEAFSICPYSAEILEGLLACDLLGFHLQNHCINFLDTANRLLECRVNMESQSIQRSGHETFVRPFPISIDSTDDGDAESAHFDMLVRAEKLKKELALENRIIGIGVDRLDYTKGIAERFLAIERLHEKYPDYRGRFTFVQIGSPSRTHIKAYHDFVSEVDRLVERINWKFKEDGWTPIIYLKKHFDADEILPYYTMADLCVVSSLHDGMNLVSKEYVHAKRDLNGALVLSQFAGASRELTDATLVNPYSIEEFAEALKLTIEMPDNEKRARMRSMRAVIADNNVFRWAGNIITELTSIAARRSSSLMKEVS
jgi:trehalose-6-phosphate synthase